MFLSANNGSRLVFPGVFTPVRATGYSTPPRTLEPETLAHMARVNAAGGVYANLVAVDDAFKFIKTRNLINNSPAAPHIQLCLDVRFGVLLDSVTGRVNTLFSLLGADTDAGLVAATPGLQGPEYLPTGLLGKPSLRFSNAGLVTAPIPCLYTGEYGHCALGQLPAPSQNGGVIYSHNGYGIDNNLIHSDGFLRQSFSYNYQGYQVYIASNGGNGYVGAPARTIARYKDTRTPFQLLASGNGEFSSIYGTAFYKDPISYTAPVALGYRSNGDGSIYTASTNTFLSTLWILDREDGTLLADLDSFIQLQYGMPL
jgi:hypothetical protein